MLKTNISVLLRIAVITLSVFGFALFTPVASSVFAADCNTSDLNAQSGANCSTPSGVNTNLFGDGGIFTTIANVALFLIGAVSVLMLIYGGIRYTISGGESNAVTAAKNTILYAIVGIVVALLAAAIVNFVLKTFISA